MKFWDTSAIVPLLVEEAGSERVRLLASEDGDLIVWWATQVEAASALARLGRNPGWSPNDSRLALSRLHALERSWTEVLPSSEVRGHARRLLLRHPLRAADALQLAAALTWAQARPDEHEFVCLDGRLQEAAAGEGFTVLGA